MGGGGLAREVLRARDIAVKGAQLLGIGSRIRNAVSTLRELFSSQPNVGN